GSSRCWREHRNLSGTRSLGHSRVIIASWDQSTVFAIGPVDCGETNLELLASGRADPRSPDDSRLSPGNRTSPAMRPPPRDKRSSAGGNHRSIDLDQCLPGGAHSI